MMMLIERLDQIVLDHSLTDNTRAELETAKNRCVDNLLSNRFMKSDNVLMIYFSLL